MAHLSKEDLAEIVATALQQTELRGIVNILKKTAELVRARGAILWVVDPLADVHARPPAGKLYVFARWFESSIQQLPLREIPINQSANGLSIISGDVQNVENMRSDPRTFKDAFSIETVNLTSMCVVPMRFEKTHFDASLSVYRTKGDPPFSQEDSEFIQQASHLLPQMYQAVRDKVRHKLLSKTSALLYAAELAAKASSDSLIEIRAGLKRVCEEVAETFQSIETSLFLEDRVEEGKTFELFATTHSDWKTEKRSYRPNRSEGLTGWVLENKRRITIFNLTYFNADISNLHRQYDGLEWRDSLDIRSLIKKYVNVPDESLPISFMAVPIIKDNDLLGVIRCCAAKSDPWFFTEKEVELLDSVATQIHRFWTDWSQYLIEKEENNVWRNFIEQVGKLNDEVREEIYHTAVNQDIFLEQVLQLAQRSINNSDMLDIMLFEEETRELYFARTLGFPEEQSKHFSVTNKRFPIEQSSYEMLPLGMLVFEDGVPRSSFDLKKEGVADIVGDTKRMLVVPISLGKETIGVLTIRGLTEKRFPMFALRMAELLGQQLGLYLSLWQGEKQQRQVFEDLWHQLKGPVRHTFARIRSLIHTVRYQQWHNHDSENVERLEEELFPLRGVSRKAKRIAINAGVFKDLSREGRLNLSRRRRERLLSNTASKLLEEAAADTELSIEGYMWIRVVFDEASVSDLDSNIVMVDMDFLEQALNCVLDNAAKYSYERTRIMVECGKETSDGHGFFFISVANRGIPLREDELTRVTQRYYRGERARATTGEGSGIGLWVVDHIMRAHGGKLDIVPTASNSVTKIRLMFPIGR